MKRTISVTLFMVSLGLLVQAVEHHRRFVHVPDELSWADAQKYCRAHHTDLAIFEDLGQMKALPFPCGLRTPCWIGLRRDEEDPRNWTWSDGEEVRFENWYWSEPNRLTEKCAYLKGRLWFDSLCPNKVESLCYEDLVLVQEEKTWEEALEHCRTLRTNSTSDNDSFYDLPLVLAENNNLSAKDLIQNAQTQEVWVGLRFLAGRWFQVNGFPLEKQLEKELPVCPDPRMNCGTMSKRGGRLSLRDCSQRRNFFCSFKKNFYRPKFESD